MAIRRERVRTVRRYRKDWNELAEREPYFSVLTEPRYLRDELDDAARADFFATGVADVHRLFAEIERTSNHPLTPRNVLDFGCGVGRLTLALASRATRVTGCDVSPNMISEAERNASLQKITNVRFVTSLDALGTEKFDFICSLIVFQHIPVREGLATLSRLLDLLAPGGTAAIHFTLHRPGSPIRRVGRRIRAAIPLVHRAALWLRGETADLPYMQMNEYETGEIQRRFIVATGLKATLLPRQEAEIEGAVFVARNVKCT